MSIPLCIHVCIHIYIYPIWFYYNFKIFSSFFSFILVLFFNKYSFYVKYPAILLCLSFSISIFLSTVLGIKILVHIMSSESVFCLSITVAISFSYPELHWEAITCFPVLNSLSFVLKRFSEIFQIYFHIASSFHIIDLSMSF